MKNNLNTISERTGVSTSTVSRVLSGQAEKYRISERTAERVRAAAEECGYIPDLVAKGLRTSRTGIIGLAVPNIDNPFFASLSCIVIGELKKLGYHVILADSMETESGETDALNMFTSRKVDGIIAVPVGSDPTAMERLSERIPIVLIDRYFPDSDLPYVGTDNYGGARMAGEYLISRGYRNILAIQGNLSAVSNRERVRGLKDAVSEREGIRCRFAGNAFSIENGRDVMSEFLFPGKERPDAVFAFSSTILLGAIMALREAELVIPEDIGVVSFDNNGFLDYLDPAVSRIEQPLQEIGSSASRILAELIENRENSAAPRHILLSPSLVIRSSCI